MTGGTEQFLRDGAALHVDDAGGHGLPVIFQHGLGGDALQTAEAFPQDARFRRITLEARGHGRSERGDSGMFAIATFAEDIAALVEHRGLGPVVVGGISMGAAIALRLAVRRPDLVRALVLARPAWVAADAPANMQPYGEAGALLGSLPPDEARAAFLTGETARRLGAEAPDNLASLLGFFDRAPHATTAALLRAIAADGPGVSDIEIRSIATPTLVIGTADDILHPLAHAESLAGLIPGARLIKIASKAQGRHRYVSEFRNALGCFLEDLL